MEPTPPRNPLEALREAFLDLKAKDEVHDNAPEVGRREPGSPEIIDEAGDLCRTDPLTGSLVRRGPEPGATWNPVDPALYAPPLPPPGPSPKGTIPDSAGIPLPKAAVTQYMVPVAGAAVGGPPREVIRQPATTPIQSSPDEPATERESEPAGGRPRGRALIYAIYAGAAALTIVTTAVTFSLRSAGETENRAGPRPARAVVQEDEFPVPTSDHCYEILTEITSGDPRRIASVTETSQYNSNNQRLYAATFTGWINAGLTIKQNKPIGDSSGLRATQVWELHHDRTTIAIATVTWHRANHNSRWLLSRWPEFHATS